MLLDANLQNTQLKVTSAGKGYFSGRGTRGRPSPGSLQPLSQLL